MGRGLAQWIHHRQRILSKRRNIVKQWVRGCSDDIPHLYLIQSGRMSKFNLNCGCKLCHYYKHMGNAKSRLSFRDKRQLKINRKKNEDRDNGLR